ncbi:xaa-Pro aminopeptidase 2 [Ranitomeya variabilis]|uniref:xaa-Pro aminopeptidase 2 n=1 Tax=Ranitomeya variabilis TaxID=490064 RepID=UPI004056CA18
MTNSAFDFGGDGQDAGGDGTGCRSQPGIMDALTVSLWTLTLFILCGITEGAPQPRDPTIRNCTVNPPYVPPTAKISTEDLNNLRQQMRMNNVSAYIIPATDPHLGEYTAVREQRRQWLTGFTGSSGTAAVTLTRAAVFTDSRYWTQAERQMDCNWELQKTLSTSEVVSWILQELKDRDEIGFDPFLFSINDWQSYNDLLEDSGKILRSIPTNLVDEVWGSQRPALPDNDIYSIPNGFVGSTWQEKVTDIRKQMEQHSQKPTAVLLSALEETAWLFNLRGQDIPYNPFFYSYSLLTVDSIRLFVNGSRIPADVHTYLSTNCSASMCVQILDYDKVRETVTDYVKGNDVKVWIGSSYTNYGVYEVIPKNKLVSENYSPIMMTKAVKTEKEQELLKQCHIRDAVAVVEYLLWLENNVPKGTVTEISGASYVDELRAKQDHFKGPSFGTISAGGLNAALPHYRPDNETDRKLSAKEMYLVDSGGQYYDGTTDITRTVHWGTPSDFEKEAYTRVLMGNIELSRLVFPPRTAGRAIESIARQALWEVGLNFGHGTGHGIGNFFAVHEWPVGLQTNNIPLTKGMFTSIEPGYYHDGHFGIRIEDIAVVVEAETKNIFGGEKYLTFETVTLVPYDRKLIDTSIMTDVQIQHVDKHYEKIRRILGPVLQKQDLHEAFRWLEANTKPLSHGAAIATSIGVLIVSSITSLCIQLTTA